MKILRLCGHDSVFEDEIGISAVDKRWLASSDCSECRMQPGYKPSEGHFSREDFIRRENLFRSPSAIRKAVADHFNLTVEELCSKNREARICLPRQIGMYLAKTMTEYSYKALAPIFGRRNHATVWHAVKKIRKKMKTDAVLCVWITEILKRIESGEFEE